MHIINACLLTSHPLHPHTFSSLPTLQETGLDQYAIMKYADSLEVVPRTIAENSGLSATDALAALYSAHAAGQATAGLDVETGACGRVLALAVACVGVGVGGMCIAAGGGGCWAACLPAAVQGKSVKDKRYAVYSPLDGQVRQQLIMIVQYPPLCGGRAAVICGLSVAAAVACN